MDAPLIDERNYEELVAEIERRAEASGWRPPAPGEPLDAGAALMRVFARYASIVIDRLNRAPEKNFLAFLNLVGAHPQPRQPARVPLTFVLAANSPVGAVVPAGTQVAAPAAEGETEDVIFETERPLVVTRSRLAKAIVYQPAQHRFRDVTAAALGHEGESFTLFAAEQPLYPELYLGSERLLAGEEAITVVFEAGNEEAAQAWSKLPLIWAYWDGEADQWQPVAAEKVTAAVDGQRFTVSLRELPAQEAHRVDGVTTGWLRVRLKHGWQEGVWLALQGIRLRSGGNGQVPPDKAYASRGAVDATATFYPFGERPRPGDILYLACEEALRHGGETVTVAVSLNEEALPHDGNPVTVWEVWNGRAWEAIPIPEEGKQAARFLASGEVALRLPERTAERAVSGESDYWLRVRLRSGDYGREAWLEEGERTLKSGEKIPVVTLRDATLAPPLVESVTFRYPQPEFSLTACLAYDGLQYNDLVAEQWPPKMAIHPFPRPPQRQPALYLGFDRPFANRSVSLYIQVAPPAPEDVGPAAKRRLGPAGAPRIAWEYLSDEGWRGLGAADETDAFAARGVVRFFGPADQGRRRLFGHDLYWLRARREDGEFAALPRLRRLLLNTVWAQQAVTVEEEVLGSGNGNSGQTFHTAQTPLLSGVCVEVREPEMPSPAEQERMEHTLGERAVRTVGGEAGAPEAIWVRWRPVLDFYESGPEDRHVMVDHDSGAVRFGDGRYGRLPPVGQNNVRISYRSGGGRRGNRPPGTIVELQTSLPYVDGVTHYEAATGGADRESLESVKRYGPRRLRHRGRAVTGEDLEDLAFAASTRVARARAVLPAFDPVELWPDVETGQVRAPGGMVRTGEMGLIIVPQSDALQPIPSPGLLEVVADYVRARRPATAGLWVSGPLWRRVSVQLEAVPASLEGSDQLPARLTAALNRFLHPLTGGIAGKGWPFGRLPHASDLYGFLQGTPGLAHVRTLSLDVEGVADADLPFLIYPGPHDVTLVTD